MRPATRAVACAVVVTLAAGCATTSSTSSSSSPPSTRRASPAAVPAATTTEVRIALTGDTRAEPGGWAVRANANILRVFHVAQGLRVGTVVDTGDLAVDGLRAEYSAVIGSTYLSRWPTTFLPVPGNHDYAVAGAGDYGAYFGTRVGGPGHYYYARDLGARWRLYALDSEATSYTAQLAWLRKDLAAHRGRWLIVVWHSPRYSVGLHGSQRRVQKLLDVVLPTHRLRLVVNGHDHGYQRWVLRTSYGTYQQLVLGNGGAPLYRFARTDSRVRARDSRHYGIELLRLRSDGTYSGVQRFANGTSYDAFRG
jgi:hypothetical protein